MHRNVEKYSDTYARFLGTNSLVAPVTGDWNMVINEQSRFMSSTTARFQTLLK